MSYEELVYYALNGDEESFTILIQEIQEKLYVIAYSYVKDKDEALDIVQECIIKSYNSLGKIKEPKFFKSYITRILINISIDRCKKRKKIVFIEDLKERGEEPYKEEQSIEESLDLKKAVMNLELKYRTIIILKYYCDLTLKEVAEITKTPLGTVKTNLNRGLKLLRVNML
ncbi:MAG: sigma-70 family RNA polymerase sigma factor [Clostridium sp.]